MLTCVVWLFALGVSIYNKRFWGKLRKDIFMADNRNRQNQNNKKQGAAKRQSQGSRPMTKEEQRRRERRTQEHRKQGADGNRAKSARRTSKSAAKKKSMNQLSRNVGMALAGIQLVVSLIFMLSLFVLNMLPVKYLGIVALLLLIVFLAVLFSQVLSKKKGIAGKVISVLVSVALAIGSFYIFKTHSTLQEISSGGIKLDKMVVAVLADDSAETIQDAEYYSFGVQYAMGGDDVRETVEAINTELGNEIGTEEYKSIQAQAAALYNGDVQAIIYNEAYIGILEEEFSDFSNSVKIIYTHNIESKVENKSAEVSVEDDSFTVYISGIDVYGAIETNSRSDVNIMAVVNPTSHQILLVTTPRDFYVEIPGISGGAKDKLTHAGIYGVDASMSTLGALYDTDIDFYARVNFTSLVTMIDALGGVDVNSEQAFTTSYDSGLVMDVAQGMNHFNGQQALAFSRERQNVDGGDFQRGKNQQAVITAMIKKAVSPAILMGANGILESVSGNVDTNMSQEQIQTLIKSQLASPAAWNIKSMAAEGTGDEQYCYSSGESLLYVTQPDMNSITAIQQAIDAVEAGEVFQDSEIAQ